jgi:catechol 2,3-dioxygenase-like lactoylglutathione lyase family enzyme
MDISPHEWMMEVGTWHEPWRLYSDTHAPAIEKAGAWQGKSVSLIWSCGLVLFLPQMVIPMSRLQISQIDHCSVLITDVERSRQFYGGILGLKEINRPRTFDFMVVWYDLGNMHIHLLLKDRADTISPRHFALRVADTAAAREHFRSHGVAMEETTVIPGADRFFIRDPDGNRIEIIQWMRPYSSEENAR